MIIAYNKNKERVHIDDAVRGEKYYCPTCGEELCIKRGLIKTHHYSHINTSNCDGWHYDMSEWHSSWQNQFPLENQEVVFEVNGKKHRADVFINNTVIEFQHSKISNEEFKDRNNFYTSLGYKVIWIFDATDSYINGDIEEQYDNNYSWNNSLVQLREYDSKLVDVYLQEFTNIWISHPDYKYISMGNDDLLDYAYLHHVDKTASISYNTFLSTNKNNLYDYEFIDNFVRVKFLHDGSFNTKLEMKNKEYCTNDVSDEILTPWEHAYGIRRFIWCPDFKYFVDPFDACHACNHLSEKYDRCKYRFEKLLSKNFDKIININYSDEGKIKTIVILKDKKRYIVKYDDIPKCILTIKEAFEDKKDTQVIRVRNINTGWKAQINKYNYKMMLKDNKCYGKVQGPETFSTHFSQKECEIFNYNKKEWELIWRK
jgi:competence CoiA-like predicted nuclease